MNVPSIRFFSILALALLSVRCGPSPTAPSQYGVFSQQDLQVGTGDTAAGGDVIVVHYTLWLYDETMESEKGPQVETTRGGDPAIVALSVNSTIRGWLEGVPGMRVGGIRRLVVPPDRAYGDIRLGIIPPRATLVFEIELLEIVEDEE